jgi:hypothetical protein
MSPKKEIEAGLRAWTKAATLIPLLPRLQRPAAVKKLIEVLPPELRAELHKFLSTKKNGAAR